MSPPVRPDRPRDLDEALGQIESLWDIVEELRAQNETLLEQLRESGRKSSRNSSRPPSSDSPEQRAARKKKQRSNRSKGAQAGHEKHERALVPEGEIDALECYYPEGRCACGGTIAIDADPTLRHQVFDLPEVRAHATEHRLYGGRCRGCGARHAGRLPHSVPPTQMGPGLLAWIAMMAGEYHLSVRQIQRLLAEQWKLRFSIGAISEAQGRVCHALVAPYRQIAHEVRGAAVAHADETRHYRGGGVDTGQWWAWTLATGEASYVSIASSRAKWAADELIGEFAGFLVTDDYGGYNHYPAARRQLCWAHLARHFTAMGERVGRGGEIGRRLALLSQALVRTRHRHERGELEDEIYRRRIGRLRRSVHVTLERGARLRLDGRTKRQCAHLLGREAMLWTFAVDERVPLTNNLAERALRPYVIWRKLAFASHSRRGDAFRAMVLSVGQTARQQGLSLYPYLRRICAEWFGGEPITPLPLGVAWLRG